MVLAPLALYVSYGAITDTLTNKIEDITFNPKIFIKFHTEKSCVLNRLLK